MSERTKICAVRRRSLKSVAVWTVFWQKLRKWISGRIILGGRVSPIQLSIFKITAAVAAVDKIITDDELSEIGRIGSNMGITEDLVDDVIQQLRTLEDEQAMIDWLTDDIVAIGNEPEGLRENMLAEMLRTARSDGTVSFEESDLLKRCKQAWELA